MCNRVPFLAVTNACSYNRTNILKPVQNRIKQGQSLNVYHGFCVAMVCMYCLTHIGEYTVFYAYKRRSFNFETIFWEKNVF